MNVKELIAVLEKAHPDWEVWCDCGDPFESFTPKSFEVSWVHGETDSPKFWLLAE